jgi:voltage-gated potassium channel
VGALLLLVTTGTLGFWLLEGWPLLDALYMTVITVTTVGFMEVHTPSTAGRLFIMVLSLGGVFTAFYAASEVIRGIVSGELTDLFGRQRVQRNLADLRDHFIVCGLGRMGRIVCDEFSAGDISFVVIDRDASVLRGFDIPHGIPLQGDATTDEVLRQAGLERARGLVTVAASDAENLFITMSARLMRENLYIVARSESEASEAKLRRAGASRVVSPYSIGGHRVAQAVLRPAVVDFIELATRSESIDLQIEEIEISGSSSLAGKTLRESGVRRELNVIVVAILKPDTATIYNPPPEASIDAEDVLIVIGDPQKLDRLAALAGG